MGMAVKPSFSSWPVTDFISLAEASGIIATLFVIFYFSRREMRSVAVDIKTKVLNDLDEKMHGVAEMLVHRPELIEVVDRDSKSQSPKLVFAYYILYMCAYAFHSAREKYSATTNGWAGCDG
jgi:hypothetical protein